MGLRVCDKCGHANATDTYNEDESRKEGQTLGAARERRRIRKIVLPIAKMLAFHGEGCDDSSDGKWFEMLSDKLTEVVSATRARKARK